MSELPYMPTAIDEERGRTEHMSAEQFGAYKRIERALWTNSGYLVDDPRQLAHITGLSLKKWNNIASLVLSAMTVAGGRISSPLVLSNLNSTRSRVEHASLAAKSRWTKAKSLESHDPTYARASSEHASGHMPQPSNKNQNQESNLLSSTSLTAARGLPMEEWLAAAPGILALAGKMKEFQAEPKIKNWLRRIKNDARALCLMFGEAQSTGKTGEAFVRLIETQVTRAQNREQLALRFPPHQTRGKASG